jgi:predicted membrane channel-forming protein YqfA (hemolysin III family)
MSSLCGEMADLDPPRAGHPCRIVPSSVPTVLAAPALVAALPLEAIVAMIEGSLLYIVGGVVYTLRRPDPFPRVFGYHEVFHLLVIAGSVVFGTVIWRWVPPVAVR